MLISFDFDDTLCFQYENSLFPILDNIVLAKNIKNNGDKLIIVTARRPTESNQKFVFDFLVKFDINDLFDDVIFVGGIKGPTLKSLGVDCHYDNDEEEIIVARKLGVRAIHRPLM